MQRRPYEAPGENAVCALERGLQRRGLPGDGPPPQCVRGPAEGPEDVPAPCCAGGVPQGGGHGMEVGLPGRPRDGVGVGVRAGRRGPSTA